MSKHYEILIDSLRLAASEPEIQIKSLPAFVVVTDEIAIDFDDAYLYKDELLLNGEIDVEISELLDEIYGEITFMTKNKVGWGIEELKKSHHWEKIREIAKKVLTMTGEDIRPPNLCWTTYVKDSQTQ